MIKPLMDALRVVGVSVLICLSCFADKIIRPGQVWLDNRGKEIQAHGGGMLRLGKTFYWFGEDRTPENNPDHRYVSCYSSEDLVHWRFRKQVLNLGDPENLGEHWVLERPKVFYNRGTKKYVLYAHLDDRRYQVARVMVAVSNTVDGNYQYVKSFRPLGRESRDIGQFVDDDGTAYLIFESRPTRGFFIARLSDDFMNVEQQTSLVDAPLEGGAIVHYGGLYYAIGSHLTGWRANPNVYATATSLSGPWTEFRDVAPPEASTYGSQSTMLLKVKGSRANTVIFMGDIWKPKELSHSRYLWMPVIIGEGRLTLPAPENWTINIRTGRSELLH
jgi:hypothetical protein